MVWGSRPCAGRRPMAMSSATWRTRNPRPRSTTTRRWKRPWLSPRSVVLPSAAHAHARGGRESARPGAESRGMPVPVCAPVLAGPVRLVVVSLAGPCAGCAWPVLTPRGQCAASKQPSQDILDHQAKRRVELKLMEFRVAMEVCSRRLNRFSLRRPPGGRLSLAAMHALAGAHRSTACCTRLVRRTKGTTRI